MGLRKCMTRLDAEFAAALETSAAIADAVTREFEERGEPLPTDRVASDRLYYNRERAYWNEGGPVMAETRNLAIPGPDGNDIPLRIHYPVAAESLPVLVYLHGGGWIMGNLDTHDRAMRVLADESGCAVVGVDYRLAPETRYPGPQRDCLAAVRWVAGEGADHGLDPARIMLGGDSAGANMAMAVMLDLRDGGESGQAILRSIRGAVHYYGSYGLRDSASRRLWGGPDDGLSKEDLAFFRKCLFADPDEGTKELGFDLLSRGMAGLPPQFVLEVVMDPLADDSKALVGALEELGIPHEYHRYDGVLHGFIHYGRAVALSRKALSEGAAFVKAHI